MAIETPTYSDPETPETTPDVEHSNLSEQQTDLTDFETKIEQQRQNSTSFEQLLADIGTNNSPENITKLRQGGVPEQDNDKDDLEKHAKLAAGFTKKQETTINGQKRITYKTDFQGNKTADDHIGLGDILPPNVETVAVYNDKGELVSAKAVRGINNKNRIGYYDFQTGNYVAVRQNYTTVILGTRNAPAKDKTVAERKIKEKEALYGHTQQTGTTHETPRTASAPETTPPPSDTGIPIYKTPEPDKQQEQKFTASRSQLKTMGFKSISKVTPAVKRKADEILTRGNPIGTVTVIEINGKKWAFRDEVHKHDASDNVSDRLKKNHHGVSVLGEA